MATLTRFLNNAVPVSQKIIICGGDAKASEYTVGDRLIVHYGSVEEQVIYEALTESELDDDAFIRSMRYLVESILEKRGWMMDEFNNVVEEIK